MTDLSDNVARVRARIVTAAERAGRRPEDVTLVAVTKKQSAQAVRDVVAAGAEHLGENYVQEAAVKREALGGIEATWHGLGHLQSNKAALAVRTLDFIESVDSVRLARLLGQHAGANGRILPILLQVHLGEEATKSGLPPDRVADIAAEVRELPGVTLYGLMGIAPLGEPPRPHFRALQRLFDALPAAQRRTLSMGMTADFETAIEEGATLVRIGTAIFGPRLT